MSRATPQMRALAGRVIGYETRGKEASPDAPPAFAVCEKLRPKLSILMGKSGFHALLSRALALARAEASWLKAAILSEEGGLSLPESVSETVDAEGSTILVAQILGLLVAFIGEDLSLRLLREIWSPLSIADLNT